MTPPETAAALLKMREDWLRVTSLPTPWGGFEIAIVIDGVYSAEYDRRELVQAWTQRIRDALAADGLPLDVPLSKCAGRAAVLGDEPMPELSGPPDFPTPTPDKITEETR